MCAGRVEDFRDLARVQDDVYKIETKAQDNNKYPKANRWRNGPWRLLAIQLLTSWAYIVWRSLTFVHTLRMSKILYACFAHAQQVVQFADEYGSAEALMAVWKCVRMDGPFRPPGVACLFHGEEIFLPRAPRERGRLRQTNTGPLKRRKAMAERRYNPQDPPQQPTAFLIGSYKFEKARPVRGVPEGFKAASRLRRKGGKKKAYSKAGEEVSPEAFVEGDLQNMKRYINEKGIHSFSTMDYREHNSDTGEYAGGKEDILNLVRDFFAQDDRTEFILYFTGHGDVDGSWCIPVTVLRDSEENEGGQSIDVTFPPPPNGED